MRELEEERDAEKKVFFALVAESLTFFQSSQVIKPQ